MKNNLPPYADLQTLQGLSENEAAARLQAEGFNELPSAKPRSIFAIAWEVVREPMFLLLVACGIIYLILGLSLCALVVVIYGLTRGDWLQGFLAGITLAIFGLFYSRGGGETEARAMCYTTLIVANLGLILSNRSRIQSLLSTLRIPNEAMWWVIGGATLFLSLVLIVPALRNIFRFAPLHPLDIAFCLAAGTSSIVGFELIKYWNRRLTKPTL